MSARQWPVAILALLVSGCAAAGDFSDDFANNLLTDLAPILALFGERVTMQFLSQSTGWADVVLLAAAPLGIATIIVSAIRVGGPAWLKAAVGRARENLAVAEVDLLTSTSEACELWNGNEIIRCMGTAPVRELIYLSKPSTSSTSSTGMPGVTSALSTSVELQDYPSRQSQPSPSQTTPADTLSASSRPDSSSASSSSSSSWSSSSAFTSASSQADTGGKIPERSSVRDYLDIDERQRDQWYEPIVRGSSSIVTRQKRPGAPNIALNSHTESRTEVRLAAAVAVLLQLGVVAWSACATYYFEYPKEKKNPVSDYSFPCYVYGTLTLVLGLAVCGNVVLGRTTKKRTEAKQATEIYHVWLQRKATVGDQVFHSTAVFTDVARSSIVVSQRSERSGMSAFDLIVISGILFMATILYGPRTPKKDQAILASKATVGMFISLSGFIVQFIGLRGLHWSVAIFQLGAVIAVTGLRLFVRRGHARPPRSKALRAGFELDWFAMHLAREQPSLPWLTDADADADARHWDIVTGVKPAYQSLKTSDRKKAAVTSAHIALTTRKDLGILTGWNSLVFLEASILKKAIELTMNSLVGISEDTSEHFWWSIKVQHVPNAAPETIRIQLQRANGQWIAEQSTIESAMSLWLYSIDRQLRPSSKGPDQEETPVDHGQMSSVEEGAKGYPVIKESEGPDEWLSAAGPSSKKNLRLLGPDSVPLRRDLRWWMPRDTGKFLKVWQPTQADGWVGKDISCFEKHRVVGCGTKPFEEYRTQVPVHRFATADLEEFDIAFQVRANSLDDDDNDDDNGGDDDEDGESTSRALATVSYCSFKLLCTQDLFTNFMWAVAKTLECPIDGHADMQVDDISASSNWKGFTFSNKRISKLANDLQNLGLGNAEEVYTSIIPALSTEEKLPDLYSIIDLARQKAEPFEQQGDLIEAGKIYLWLFRALGTFHKQNDVVVKATAELVDHLRQVIEEIGHRESYYDHNADKLKLMYQHKSEIEDLLQGNETYPDLILLYRLKGRYWQSDGLMSNNPPTQTRGIRYISPDSRRLIMNEPNDLPDTFHLTDNHVRAQLGISADETQLQPDAVDVLGWTPLHYATSLGHEKIVGTVISAAGDSNARDSSGLTPLHYACLVEGSKGAGMVRRLLNRGADIEAQGRNGTRPLHCAAKIGNEDSVRLLIEAGASADVFDSARYTPMMWTALKRHHKALTVLYENSSKILRGRHGRTLLHLAALSGCMRSLRMLQEKGLDYSQDGNGLTPLNMAAWAGHGEAVRFIMDKFDAQDEISMNQSNEYTSPFYSAVQGGQAAMMKILIDEFGADIDAVESDKKYTYLHIATRHNQEAIVKLLLDQGADIEARGADDSPPLYLAIKHGHTDLARLLLDRGADIQALGWQGRTALHAAATFGPPDSVSLLLDRGADIEALDRTRDTPLHSACSTGEEAIVRLFLDRGADIEAHNKDGETPLDRAVGHQHEAVVILLIKRGANKEAQETKPNKYTVLHKAARRNKQGMAELLVKLGANLDALDSEGKTPREIALEYGHNRMAELLDIWRSRGLENHD